MGVFGTPGGEAGRERGRLGSWGLGSLGGLCRRCFDDVRMVMEMKGAGVEMCRWLCVWSNARMYI